MPRCFPPRTRLPASSLSMLRRGAASPVDDLLSLGTTLLELQLGALPWEGALTAPPVAGDPSSGCRPEHGCGKEANDAGLVPPPGRGRRLSAQEPARSGEFGRRALAAIADAREAAWNGAVRRVRPVGGSVWLERSCASFLARNRGYCRLQLPCARCPSCCGCCLILY